jgi:Ca2+/Na+ antiporter
VPELEIAMKTFLIYSIRIVSGLLLPIGIFSLVCFLISILLLHNLTAVEALFYFVLTFILFVPPLLVLIYLNPKNAIQPDTETTISESNSTERPTRKTMVYVFVLIAIGLVPLLFLFIGLNGMQTK